MAYNTFTLTGTFKRPNGDADKGAVVAIPSVTPLVDSTGKIILAGAVTAQLDANGAFTMVLPTTGAGLLPASFGYTLLTSTDGHGSGTRSVTITPGASGTTLNMADVVPAPLPAVVTPTAVTTAGLDGAVQSLVNDTAAGTRGAVNKAVGRYFTPEAYGAVGDGVADDTAAVRSAFDAANALARTGLTGTIQHPGASVVLTGQYNLSTLAAPIDIKCNVLSSRASLITPAAYAGIAVRVGHLTSGSLFQNASIDMPDVVKPSGSTIIASSVGVRVMNLANSSLTFSRTALFETGLHFTGLGQGTAYNQVNIGWVSYCKVSLKLVPDTGGWVNQNTFVSGGIQQSTSFAGGIRQTGWRHLVIDGAGINPVNGNTFVGVSFEGDASEYTFAIASAYNNTWVGCRHELGTASIAVTVTASSATLASTAHGLAVGDMVVFNATVAPTNMFLSSPYYVVSVPDANSYTVSAKKGGTAVVFGSTGTAVTSLRPPKIFLDTSVTNSNNVIRNPATPTSPAFLEIINSTGSGSGNTVETATARVVDNFYLDDLPPFRARNRSSTPTVRPMFAAYPSGANPVEDPYGWTAAIGDPGVLFAASGAETGRVTNSGGVLSYKRPADSVSFELASCRRSPGLLSVSSLSCGANANTSTTFTLTGASVNDHLLVTPLAALPTGIVWSHAYVSSADTITVVFTNVTAGSISVTVNLQAIAFRRFF